MERFKRKLKALACAACVIAIGVICETMAAPDTAIVAKSKEAMTETEVADQSLEKIREAVSCTEEEAEAILEQLQEKSDCLEIKQMGLLVDNNVYYIKDIEDNWYTIAVDIDAGNELVRITDKDGNMLYDTWTSK